MGKHFQLWSVYTKEMKSREVGPLACGYTVLLTELRLDPLAFQPVSPTPSVFLTSDVHSEANSELNISCAQFVKECCRQ